MAQGDKPVITEVPEDVFPLVHIQHPQHQLAFQKLGLRWVPAPALSRLGFTIGGVQYTASPFVGWFMDAEIGVRNLVDPFRYNVLPQVIKQMGLFDGNLDELPDFERLALMVSQDPKFLCIPYTPIRTYDLQSRAQVELNYAVSWSFANAKVRMIDSLGASELFSRFDDEHLTEHGYRMPSDPYWIAPPQGSLIPLWHRGAAPNYQPKPMICHHAQDPIKAWRREQQRRGSLTIRDSFDKLTVPPNTTMNARRIFVGFCSSGTVAAKLCNKLQRLLFDAAVANPNFGTIMPVQTLNAIRRAKLHSDDTLVVVASNTRRGEMPTNGTDFLEALGNNNLTIASRFAIFGNGSLDYVDTFNQNAKVLETLLRKGGATSLLDSVHADTAVENPPWATFNLFCRELMQSLTGAPPTPELEAEELKFMEHPTQMTLTHTKTWFHAKITDINQGLSEKSMKCIGLDIDSDSYAPMSYISILPPNPESVIQSLVRDLNSIGDEPLSLVDGVTVEDFFRLYADLQQPFKRGEWSDRIVQYGTLSGKELEELPILQAVTRLPSDWRDRASIEDLCRAVPRIQPRKYSIASDSAHAASTGGNPSQLELLVQHHDGGRFSDICLKSVQLNSPVACRIERAPHLERMASAVDSPLILFCTGSGLAPIRALLQHRSHLLMVTESISTTRVPHAPISLLAGFKADDEDFVQEAVAEARSLSLFDIVSLTPSNPEKRRAQDAVFEEDVGRKLVEKIRDNALVFVCAKAEAEEDFLGNLSALLGADVRGVLGGRYMADVYQPAV
jgi:sulfite reductase alpha subunit-like flavoprotein